MTQTATSLSATAPPALPIRRALRRVDLRLRSAASGRGLGMASLVAALGACLGMAADFAWTLPGPSRWAIWGWWIVAVGLFAVLGVVRPLLRKARWIDLAAVAERADPRLGERLTGSIALLDRSTPTSGSPALIAALAEDAAGHVGEFDPSLVKAPGRPRAWLAFGLAALAMVAAPSIVRPDPFRTLALRFLAPWMDLERVGRFALAVTPGDKEVATGSDFAVEATVTPRFGSTDLPDVATLEWTDAMGNTNRARMSFKPSTSPRVFEATLPRLAGSVSYRVSTDSARSRAYQVTALEPPKICEFSARIEPPSYTKLPAFAVRDPDRIEALEGSKVVLKFYSCQPYRKIEMTWPSLVPGQPRKIDAQPSSGWKHAIIAAEAEASGPFVLTLLDSYKKGIDGQPETRQLIVKADAAPTVAAKGPPSPSEARPDDLLEVGVAARDDFGVASAELHYEIRRSKSDESQAGMSS